MRNGWVSVNSEEFGWTWISIETLEARANDEVTRWLRVNVEEFGKVEGRGVSYNLLLDLALTGRNKSIVR